VQPMPSSRPATGHDSSALTSPAGRVATMMIESANHRPRVPTLHKMGELLQLFTPARPRWRMAELALAMGWSEPTTHRFLTAMVEIDLLATTRDGAFTVGLLPVQLGAVYLSVEPRREQLIARLDAIAEETGLTTQIGVLDSRAVTVIASLEGRSALKAAANLGERLPLHATALGKVILSQVVAEEVLPRRLERFTAKTCVARTKVLKEVAAVRKGRLARADSELANGLYALAAPVPAVYFNDRPGGLACAGPGPALVPEHWQRAEEILLELGSSLRSEAAQFRRDESAA
jgi:IclR family pca regulon transcriptional regulator